MTRWREVRSMRVSRPLGPAAFPPLEKRHFTEIFEPRYLSFQKFNKFNRSTVQTVETDETRAIQNLQRLNFLNGLIA